MKKEEILKLIEAIKAGNLSYIKKLAKVNLDWLTTPLDGQQRFAIHYAAKQGQLKILQFFLKKKVLYLI